MFLVPREAAADWAGRLAGLTVLDGAELTVPDGVSDRALTRADAWLDRQLGYHPLAIRLNHRHGFHAERMQPGHPNWMLDTDRDSRLPHRPAVERAMERWFFGARRHVPGRLLETMRRECSGLVLSNAQPASAVPFLTAARRLRLPVVAHIASWDHTVGKGVISPHCALYVVQNRVMEDDLRLYHGIAPERVRVTGWPQTDLFHRSRPRAEYEALLGRYGLDPRRPLVLVAGNTPSNAPYEGRFVERLLGWWEQAPRDRPQLLFRPHPRDSRWRERFAAAAGREGVAVQEASFTDLEDLATLLQHVDVVVCNAGTILLDALVGDRPAVCVLYDEGAPAGESWAAKNVVGKHYEELAASGAFYRAESFAEVVSGIERALEQPGRARAAAAPGGRSGRRPRRRAGGRARRRRRPRRRPGRAMRLVMTLLARNEADVVDAQLAFHLHAGVDHVIAMDNASSDGTTEILERYERAGLLRLIREPGDDMRQDEWVTRMARLAATEHGADWVINADADEFWWPRGGSLKDVLATVPERYGVVRGCWRHFLPRPDDGSFFAERMTVRLATPADPGDKETIFHAHQKVAHRAHVRGRDRAREPQRRGPGARATPRLASDRGHALLVPLGRAARAQGARWLASQRGVTSRPCIELLLDAAFRERPPRRVLRLVRGRRRRARPWPRGRHARRRHAPARRAASALRRDDGTLRPARRRSGGSRSRARVPPTTRRTPQRRRFSSRSTASSAPSSACGRSRAARALERGPLNSSRRLARR